MCHRGAATCDSNKTSDTPRGSAAVPMHGMAAGPSAATPDIGDPRGNSRPLGTVGAHGWTAAQALDVRAVGGRRARGGSDVLR